MPDNDRWTAAMYGKTWRISPSLRSGICETLVLLAVYGNALLGSRLGVDFEARASRLVKDLLSPLTTRQFEEHNRDLPMYAEAAPEEFLTILETDLKSLNPASLGLMRPVDTGAFARCARSEILWALESLCWSPSTLLRAVRILARFSQVKLEDNWLNKPTRSLAAVFRAWMPQTAPSLAQRISAVEQIAREFPDVAWRICVDQFGSYNQVGHYSFKPRWRNDAQGHGQPTSGKEAYDFMIAMVDLAIGWNNHTKNTISDLIERVHVLDEGRQSRVWELLANWAATATDADKAWMREKIRVGLMSRRAKRLQRRESASAFGDRARAAFEALEPAELFNKHEWLFRQQWLEESAAELQGEQLDFQRREERVNNLRTSALTEIFSKRGVAGVLEFAELGKAPSVIGFLMTKIIPRTELAEFALSAMPPDASEDTWSRTNIVAGVLRGLDDDNARGEVLGTVKEGVTETRFAKILQLAPFVPCTWTLVDALDDASQTVYWSEVVPGWDTQSDSDVNDGVGRLLKARRSRAAFAFVNFRIEKAAPSLLHQLMTDIALGGNEVAGHFQIDPWRIAEAFRRLDDSKEFSIEKMAMLDFPYIEALSRDVGQDGAHGVPNLETYLESHPDLVVQAVGGHTSAPTEGRIHRILQ